MGGTQNGWLIMEMPIKKGWCGGIPYFTKPLFAIECKQCLILKVHQNVQTFDVFCLEVFALYDHLQTWIWRTCRGWFLNISHPDDALRMDTFWFHPLGMFGSGPHFPEDRCYGKWPNPVHYPTNQLGNTLHHPSRAYSVAPIWDGIPYSMAISRA